jgi:hypothetical protein
MLAMAWLAMDDDATRLLNKLLADAARDPLRLPDLETWFEAFGGYHKIPPEAWRAWDELYEERKLRRLELGGRR